MRDPKRLAIAATGQHRVWDAMSGGMWTRLGLGQHARADEHACEARLQSSPGGLDEGSNHTVSPVFRLIVHGILCRRAGPALGAQQPSSKPKVFCLSEPVSEARRPMKPSSLCCQVRINACRTTDLQLVLQALVPVNIVNIATSLTIVVLNYRFAVSASVDSRFRNVRVTSPA